MFMFLLVPVVAANIVFGPCPGLAEQRSCYMQPTNTVYLAPLEMKYHARRATLAHELGHAYYFQAMTDTQRSRWGVERFALAYEDCALNVYARRGRICRWLWERSPYRLLQRRQREAARPRPAVVRA